MGSADRRLILILPLFLPLSLLSPSCLKSRSPSTPARPCIPRCLAQKQCHDLDDSLVLARKPLLQCIGKQAQRGHLSQAHRCYRSLRLLESARWWLKTVMNQSPADGVYQISETTRREFLCKIEQLARSRTPEDVERVYMEMIRAFP